ncbi:MAG: hypothetical protein HQ518_18170 [Rhodopirellula sp.]|nr:hypothetical protein [Rhodopirellula sp.]
MTGPIKALTWEFMRRVSVTVPFLIPFLIIGPMALEGLFWIAGLNMEIIVFAPLVGHGVYLSIGFMVMAIPLVEAYKGVYQRMYVLPISSTLIASWMMISAIVTVVGQEVLIHWVYGFTLSDWSYVTIFGEHRGVLSTCQPVFATTVCIMTAMFWNMKFFRFRKLLVCVLVWFLYISWIFSRYFPHGFHFPNRLSREPEAWMTLSVTEGVICLSIIAASWVVTYRGIVRDRCGDNIGYSLEKRVEDVTNWIKAIIFPDGVRDHASPEAAIAWNQWRHCGRDAALAAGIGFGTLPAIFLFSSFDSRRGLEGIVVLLFIIPGVVGFLTGSVLGILAPSTARERITMFLATSPVSDARLARGLLWNAWRTTLIAWGLVILLGLLALGAAIFREGGSSLQVQIDQLTRSSHQSFGVMILPLALLASGVLAWTLTATSAVLHWTGNHLLPLSAIVGVLAVGAGLSLLSFFVDKEMITLLREAAMIAAAAVIVAGSLVGFWTAFQRKMVEPGSAAVLLSFWVVESLLCWFYFPAPPLHRLFVIGILILSVSPIAFAPLAISRNRHAA